MTDEDTQRKEANTCIGLGIGVGALGAAGAAVSSAVCPLCVVIAPALIGWGVFKRATIAKEPNGESREDAEPRGEE